MTAKLDRRGFLAGLFGGVAAAALPIPVKTIVMKSRSVGLTTLAHDPVVFVQTFISKDLYPFQIKALQSLYHCQFGPGPLQ